MKSLKRIIPLAVVLFAFWIILASQFRLTVLLAGAGVSLLLALLAYFFLPTQFDAHLNPRFILRLPVFLVLLLWEILKANWDVWKRVMAPRMRIDPRIVHFDSYLESDAARTTLAGSINLTPGTVTLEIDDNTFTVHCLAREIDEDLAEGKLERMVAWLFAEGPPENRRLK